MAWFRCMVGAGNALELIVTCAAAFAGQTITCTDGTSTLTATCPSSSPYEITFKLPNYGTWTVSGTTGGQTYSESIVVQPYEVELFSQVDITVDVYSAANDTVSYTGLDGQTHTITTDSSGHATATITIMSSGSSLTFTSSVAKNPNNLSNAYSKAITLTSTTTSVYVMPNNTKYWYGYNNGDLQIANTSNGWSGRTYINPSFDINSIYCNASGGFDKSSAIGTQSKETGTYNMIGEGISAYYNTYGAVIACTEKDCNDAYIVASANITTSAPEKVSLQSNSSIYFCFGTHATRQCRIYAIWKD